MATANLPGIQEIMSPGALNISGPSVETDGKSSPASPFEDVINKAFVGGRSIKAGDKGLARLQEENNQEKMCSQGAYAMLNAFYTLLAQYVKTGSEGLQDEDILGTSLSLELDKGLIDKGQEGALAGDIGREIHSATDQLAGPKMSAIAENVRQDKMADFLKAWEALNGKALVAAQADTSTDDNSLATRIRAFFMHVFATRDKGMIFAEAEDITPPIVSQTGQHQEGRKNLLPFDNEMSPRAPLTGMLSFPVLGSISRAQQPVAAHGKGGHDATKPNMARDPGVVTTNHQADRSFKASHHKAIPPDKQASAQQTVETPRQDNKLDNPGPKASADGPVDEALREPRPANTGGRKTNGPSFIESKDGVRQRAIGQNVGSPFNQTVKRSFSHGIQDRPGDKILDTVTMSGPRVDRHQDISKGIIEAKVDTILMRDEDRANASDRSNGAIGTYNHAHLPPLKGTKGQQVPGGVDVTGQLSKGVSEAIKSNQGRLVLHLDPPELGSVQIRIVVNHHNEISATFLAEHPETRHTIEQNLGGLRQQLANQGFSLGDVNVGLGHGGGFGHARDQDGRQIFDGPIPTNVLESRTDGHAAARQTGQVVASRSGSSVHLIA